MVWFVNPAIGDEFNNDSILETSRTTGAPAGFVGRTHRYLNAADDILLNKETYQNALVIDEGSKSRKLFEILESKNLIKSVSRTEV